MSTRNNESRRGTKKSQMGNIRNDMVIIVDHEGKTVDVLKQAIEERKPYTACLSFRYADEAMFAMCNELKHLPGYIFLVANDAHIHTNQYMAEFRNRKGSHDSKIVVFAEVLPPTVANTFLKNGATFAFQKPISRTETRSIIQKVFG
jgi:hypothetical protein